MNLQTLTDEELAEHAIAVQTEKERRQRLDTVPATISTLASQYLADGGEQAALDEAILAVVE